MLEVNVLALAVCTCEALQDLQTRGDDGHIIHVCRCQHIECPPGLAACTPQASMKAMTEALRRELRARDSGTATSVHPASWKRSRRNHAGRCRRRASGLRAPATGRRRSFSAVHPRTTEVRSDSRHPSRRSSRIPEHALWMSVEALVGVPTKCHRLSMSEQQIIGRTA